jgi:aryl-alcohol dehydrogenase-like predicted oxidoreductase
VARVGDPRNWFERLGNRDEVVIATKVHAKMHDGPNGAGLSRKAILREIDKSLKRLETGYVDLYQIPRWDYQTSIEETMEALHEVVRAGRFNEAAGYRLEPGKQKEMHLVGANAVQVRYRKPLKKGVNETEMNSDDCYGEL